MACLYIGGAHLDRNLAQSAQDDDASHRRRRRPIARFIRHCITSHKDGPIRSSRADEGHDVGAVGAGRLRRASRSGEVQEVTIDQRKVNGSTGVPTSSAAPLARRDGARAARRQKAKKTSTRFPITSRRISRATSSWSAPTRLLLRRPSPSRSTRSGQTRASPTRSRSRTTRRRARSLRARRRTMMKRTSPRTRARRRTRGGL